MNEHEDKIKEIWDKIFDLVKKENLSPSELIALSIPMVFSGLHLLYNEDSEEAKLYIQSIIDMLHKFVTERILDTEEETKYVH